MADPRYKHGVYVGRCHKQQSLSISFKRSSLIHNGWERVNDPRRIDAGLLALYNQEKDPNTFIYQLEHAGTIAWAYISQQHQAVLVTTQADTRIATYTGPFNWITSQVKQWLATPYLEEV